MIIALLALGCRVETGQSLSRDELMDPQSCAECHPSHYAEWSGSMHAYAGEDPVFIAMNARGQRETDGALGDFCVKCHAPMALVEGETFDGTDLAEVPEHLRGVTCFFCHTVDGVTGDHNASLSLSGDLVMRGAISDPVDNDGHASAYDPGHDREDVSSAELCGSCHDVVTPTDLHLERTYAEWQGTIYAQDIVGLRQTCGSCHMQGRDDVAADVEGVGLRRVHDHRMAGVDLALSTFPESDPAQMEAQREAVQTALDTTLLSELIVVDQGGSTEISLQLENVAAGHSWPSGAGQDRRAWVQVQVWSGDEISWQTGVVGEGVPLVDVEDGDTWRFGDRLYDADGEEVHMFWEAHSLTTTALPGLSGYQLDDPEWVDSHVTRTWSLPGIVADRVEARVFIRAMGLDVLDSLIASGDLDPAHRDAIPTIELTAAAVSWPPEVSGR